MLTILARLRSNARQGLAADGQSAAGVSTGGRTSRAPVFAADGSVRLGDLHIEITRLTHGMAQFGSWLSIARGDQWCVGLGNS
jgi:hypothetical protein